MVNIKKGASPSKTTFFNSMASRMRLPLAFRRPNDPRNTSDAAGKASAAAAEDAAADADAAGANQASFSSTMDFLMDGFVELLKCRQILRASFAYSFFAFGDEERDR
jgi:hypothetical protein